MKTIQRKSLWYGKFDDFYKFALKQVVSDIFIKWCELVRR